MKGKFTHTIWSRYYLKLLILLCLFAAGSLMVTLQGMPILFYNIGSGVMLALFAVVCLTFFQTGRDHVNTQVAVSFGLLLLLVHTALFFDPGQGMVQTYFLVATLGYSLLLSSPEQLRGYLGIQILLIWGNILLGSGSLSLMIPFGAVFSISAVFYYLLVCRMMKKQRDLWLVKKEESEIRMCLERQTNSLQEYKYIVDLSSNLICVADYSGYFLEVNPAFVKLLGYTKEELLSRPFMEFVHPEDRDKTRRKIHLLSGKNTHDPGFENRYITRSGDIVYLKWNVTAAPERSKIYAIVQDVTEQKMAQMAIQAYQTRLQSLFEQETVGLALTTLDGVFVMANPAMEAILGYDKRFLTSLSLHDIIYASDRHLLEDSVYLLAREERNTFAFDQRCICEDGSLKWVRAEIGILRSEQGKPAYLVCTLIDINDRKTAENALKESEAYLLQAQRIANMGYWAVNLADMKPIWSEETYRIHGVDSSALAPTLEASIDFYDEASRPLITEAFTRCLIEGEPYDLKLGIITAQGMPKWVRVVGEPEYENGDVVKVFGIFQDITNQVKNEQDLQQAGLDAEQAAQAKTMFLSNMSHEIRTPLNALIGSTHLMLQENPRPDQQEMLEIMKFSGNNLMTLVNDILDFSKIESGKLVLEQIDVEVRPFLHAIVQAHRYRAAEKELDLRLDIDQDVPGMISTDPTRVTQVINNLMSNALKFTEQGEVVLQADLAQRNDSTCRLRISVKDSGIGIPKEQQEHIFASFTQATTETTRKYGGTGLGLAISRNLIQLLGGEIRLESEPGKGSVFTIEIDVPVVQVICPEYSEKRMSDSKLESLEGTRILLVEDNQVNVRIAQRFLKKWSAEVETVHNGQEAVEAVRNSQFDLVLMDIRMPVMGGEEATKTIRTFNTETPIIALTASTLSEVKKQFEHIGFDGFVTKPFRPAELFDTIREKVSLSVDGD